MIYKEPSIYKMGGDNSEIEIHESILDYADDWEDISTDFQLYSGASIYKNYGQPGDISDLKALISRTKKLLYFNDINVRIFGNAIDPTNWNFLLKYIGNEIKFQKDGGVNPTPNNFLHPTNVRKGTNLFYMVGNNGGTTNDFCFIGWVGSDNTNTYLSYKRAIDNNTGGLGFLVGQLCFNIDLF